MDQKYRARQRLNYTVGDVNDKLAYGGLRGIKFAFSWGYFGHDEALHGVVFFDTSAVKTGLVWFFPLFWGDGGRKKGGRGHGTDARAHDRLPRRDWGKRLF
jgi:hypothetical protein